MQTSVSFKNTVTDIICFLYIVLFVYAAINKLLDFENFQVQLGQSPLLSSFAGFVSYTVISVEFIVSLMLCLPRTRYAGIFAAFCLMSMFSTYIFIMLNFSPFVPCSCGGILEKMSWTQHLIFNVVFVVIALVALLIGRIEELQFYIVKKHGKAFVIVFGAICSIGIVTILFVLSEDTIHRRNNFVRRFPHHPVMIQHQMDLGQFTYYLAGIVNDKIFVANSLAPLDMTVFDTALKSKERYRITLPRNTIKFRTVRVAVIDSTFYVSDGTVPVIFKGSIKDWKATVWMQGKAYFTHLQPLDDNKIAIRAVDLNRENVLGLIDRKNNYKVTLNKKLLEKQIDGDFDTDGSFLFNKQLNRIVYTYFYRNQFILADDRLTLDYRGNTIDTTTKARIKVATIKSRNERTFSAPPYIVNKRAATFGKYLFVHAGLIGRYEPEDVWETASIIDVYDLKSKTYAFSFYVNDENGEKMTDFKVDGKLLIALFGRNIAVYSINSIYYQHLL